MDTKTLSAMMLHFQLVASRIVQKENMDTEVDEEHTVSIYYRDGNKCWQHVARQNGMDSITFLDAEVGTLWTVHEILEEGSFRYVFENITAEQFLALDTEF
jgi:hypothetical protein